MTTRSCQSSQIAAAFSRGELSIRMTPSMGCTNVEMLMTQVGTIPSPFAASIIEQAACALDAARGITPERLGLRTIEGRV